MVSATQRAKSQQGREQRSGLLNLELLREAGRKDWLSQETTIAAIRAIETAIEAANNLAVTTREVKFLDRAHGLREALEIIKNQKP